MTRWALLVALMLVLVSGAQATAICGAGTVISSSLCGYTNDPTTNSAEWANAVFANFTGVSINTQVDFTNLAINTPGAGSFTGSTNPAYYFNNALIGGLNGYKMTIGATGVFDYYGVQDSSNGPGGNGSSGGTPSPGEGVSPTGNMYLGPNQSDISAHPSPTGTAGSVTFSLSSGVNAFGLFIINLDNAGGANPDTLAFYSGSNGGGTLIATLTPAQFNFGADPTVGCPTCAENDYYFMGLLSTSTPIMSVVFTTTNTNLTNYVDVDNIRFATIVPEPGSLALVLGGGLALLVLCFRRRMIR